MEIALNIATLLGGIVALWFLYEKFFIIEAKEKFVNNSWWESSRLNKKLTAKGYSFRWSNPQAVEERVSNGYEIIYEKTLLTKHKLINSSGQVLIGKKNK